MARRRRKKNPTTAQKVVLVVGGVIGVGLVATGIYLAVKKPAAQLPPEGLGGGVPGVQTYTYSVVQKGPNTFEGIVFLPTGRRIMLGDRDSYAIAQGSALTYIAGVGGIAEQA